MRSLILRLVCLSASIVALAPTVAGQVAAKPSLTLDGARRVIAAALAEARAKNAPGGVIAVVDDGGNLMALERLDNTFAAGANISIGKARTAALFKRPTRIFEDIIKNGRTAMVALNDFTPLQGGVPVLVDGIVVGGVGVSGAASAQQDEELAIAGANAVATPVKAAAETSMPAPVTYFAKDVVAASFAKGSVLVDGSGGRSYMVHTSRRDQAGQAEVHARDTDIIYVISGSATFVTGGSLVDGRMTAADEVRGASIRGGETRGLGPGDVVVVPNGTPHWFKSVTGPLQYYVVKVQGAATATTGGRP
jgi:glc operon protein GlcG